MKILLINPPTSDLILTNLPKVLAQEDPMPPLGLMYVAAYLKKHTNHEIKILDCLIEKINRQQLETRIEQERPDVIGITSLTFTLIDVLKTAKIAKQVNSDIKVVLGGPHVNIYPEETLNFPEIDYLILGEGEKPVKDLIDNLGQTKNLYNFKGIAFKDNHKIINPGPRELIENLDELPFPARDLVPNEKYSSVLSENNPVTTMFSSRGCPFRCTFCNRAHLGKIFRARSAKNVVDEMEECKRMGIGEIFIYDDTFTINRQRVLDICSEIEKRKLKISWDVRARVDTVDQEILEAMKKTGCQRIHYGVEAGTQKVLDVMKKGITLEQVEKAFKLTQKAGIQTLAYFMIGSPRETRKDIFQTIKFAKKINPDFVCFSITTPYPLTELYSQGLNEKILPYDYWKEFAKNPQSNFVPFVWEEKLSRKELFLLFKKAYHSFYLRPSYILKKILQLKSAKELLDKAKTALGVLKI
jgi:anaerobic magnesium-protoporphyrin IX monomethyl ester cyclase